MLAWPVQAAVNTNTQIETPKVYLEAPSRYIAVPPKFIRSNCACIIFAREYTGRVDVKGWAGVLKPTIQTPYVGGIVITKEGNGHVAVITKIKDSSLHIIESNYLPCQIGTRIIDINNPLIIGYR